MLFCGYEFNNYFASSSSVVRRRRVLLWGPCYRRRRDWFNSGDLPDRLFHGRIPPHENVTEYRAAMPCNGQPSGAFNTIMKTLFAAEATFKSGRLETNQTLNGLSKVNPARLVAWAWASLICPWALL